MKYQSNKFIQLDLNGKNPKLIKHNYWKFKTEEGKRKRTHVASLLVKRNKVADKKGRREDMVTQKTRKRVGRCVLWMLERLPTEDYTKSCDERGQIKGMREPLLVRLERNIIFERDSCRSSMRDGKR